MTDRVDFVTPSERTAIVTAALMRGERLTPQDVAERTECELRAAYYVLNRLARILPLYEDGGKWALLTDDLNLNIE